MNSWGNIAFDFYTFGSLVGVIFTFYNAQFFLTVKEKSEATYRLGMGTLWLGLFHFGYMINFSFMGPAAAYLRWLVIIGAMAGASYLTSFFLSYPEVYFPRLKKYLFGIMNFIVVTVTGYFVYISLTAGRLFFFSGHYWDFPLPVFYKAYALIVLVFFVSFSLVAIIQIFKMPKESRFATASILIAFILVTILPGIMNAQSRDGAIGRGLYQTITDLVLVVGLFVANVVYINNTKDKTTIISRIIGISLASFLLVLQLVAYSVIQQSESNYDMVHTARAKNFIAGLETDQVPSFHYTYDIGQKEFVQKKGMEETAVDPASYESEYWNSWALETILSYKGKSDWKEKTENLIPKLPETSRGYASEIKRLLALEKVSTPELLIEELESEKRKILYTRNKLREIPEKNFSDGALSLVSKTEGPLSGFYGAARSVLETSISEAKKAEVLDQMFSPMPNHGDRNYRGRVKFAENNPEYSFYVSYLVVDKTKGLIHEVGYPYLDYREFQEEVTLPWIIGVLSLAVLVIFGYRLFFLIALLRPIEQIIEGLTEVNSGNLEHRLTVHVEDDIGFMARSFNRMVRSIQAARKKLEQYADQLEVKVQERTKELENSLKEVQSLKHQQDGDYFLTSLLLQPFNANNANHDNVQVDFLLEQKKKFTFRQYEKEIGGDLNIANQIFLNNRSYTVFLNADAMGKSMQGAGGALVLGSVFESIITRTQLLSEARNTYPERWIKNTFLELHKIFEGFDGSMLVSLVLGLIDNETGLLYFINAEHPWMVLYRDGIASFIENELMFRKLGTSGVQGNLYIKTFQLEAGDVLLAGSDGRDDLLISHTEDGKRVINEDERLFLRVVESGRGELDGIYEELRKYGSLTDDLSILRVSFIEEKERYKIEKERLKEIQSLLHKAKEASESADLQEAVSYLEQANSLEENIPEIKKKFIQLYLKLKDYGNAKKMAKDYSLLKPMDTEIMYITAFCARKVADIKTAIDFGERVRLRDPNHVKNLINLGQTYLADKNLSRAENILSSALELDPENPSLQRLLDHIRKKQNKQDVVN
ncbi:HAMP domain-containing protein [Leptospira kanakyensis]|uniref:HAMP domain-containing protein n=1 Tax=Leptospira kanakyensis TaxID=2484968 RepID=A0A6N4QGP2_9LEPT|nr:SpoIIE family protein phosphatase [Leptospira kanakyensis]TGK53539.1 HAMP domain-containing protein [Leptospira kanakyensis]TGK57334.1 HAMP domain-containing protein [Leptospira kanakyensis]TGK73046.1 HAMP domain-containing protein [Leptospira kanakyensis]